MNQSCWLLLLPRELSYPAHRLSITGIAGAISSRLASSEHRSAASPALEQRTPLALQRMLSAPAAACAAPKHVCCGPRPQCRFLLCTRSRSAVLAVQVLVGPGRPFL